VSEQYIYVSCRCFRNGQTSPPPIPRRDLRLDAFGNVSLADGTNAEDAPGELYEWVRDRACAHHHMREINAIFHSYLEYPAVPLRHGRSRDNSDLVRELDGGNYPELVRLLVRFRHAHGVVVWPSEASGLLAELARVAAVPVQQPAHVGPDASSTTLADTVYFLRPLKAALELCLANTNPIVTYYSGNSLGFDGAERARPTR
jgi:hypothetical protein